MRLVTWNCRGGFHRKAAALAALKPDLAIIQECAPPPKWRQALPGWQALWHGAESPIGVAVLARPGLSLALGAPLSDEIRCFVPAHVEGEAAFGALGVWTKQGRPTRPGEPRPRAYIGQLALAIDRYADLLAQTPCILAGDLNSNAIWDTGKPWQHLAVAARLQSLGLVSVYHHYFGERFGAETLPTYRHNTGQPFHLDYCFLPQGWLGSVRACAVGGDEWLQLSDHRPLVVDVDL